MARLGELLVAKGYCTPKQVEQACLHQALFGGRIGTGLIELGAVTEEQIARALEEIHGTSALSGEIEVDAAAIALVSRRLIERHDVVPYAVMDARVLLLLVADPRDVGAIDEVAFATGKRVVPIIVPQARIWALLRQHYGIRRRRTSCGLDDGASTWPRRFPIDRRIDVVGCDLIDEAEFERLYMRT